MSQRPVSSDGVRKAGGPSRCDRRRRARGFRGDRRDPAGVPGRRRTPGRRWPQPAVRSPIWSLLAGPRRWLAGEPRPEPTYGSWRIGATGRNDASIAVIGRSVNRRSPTRTAVPPVRSPPARGDSELHLPHASESRTLDTSVLRTVCGAQQSSQQQAL